MWYKKYGIIVESEMLSTILGLITMIKPILTSTMLVLTLTACGFHLKGTHLGSTEQVQTLHYPQLKLDIPQQYNELQKQLKVYLTGSGVTVDSDNGVVLKVVDYQFRRQQLNGKLTEILLHLNVTFHIEDQSGKILTQDRTVRTYRNYQYDIETVNTENQQEQYLKRIMIDDIAQQISTQVINNRLPIAQY